MMLDFYRPTVFYKMWNKYTIFQSMNLQFVIDKIIAVVYPPPTEQEYFSCTYKFVPSRFSPRNTDALLGAAEKNILQSEKNVLSRGHFVARKKRSNYLRKNVSKKKHLAHL